MKAEKDVQPIRNQQQLDDMKWALKRHCSERDYILFILGCETGLRVRNLLRLPTQQILALKGKQNKILRVKEDKTQKIRDIYIANCFQEVYEYAKNVQSACLFPSRKGDSPFTPTQAYRQLNKAAEYAGVEHVRQSYLTEDIWVLVLQGNKGYCDVATNNVLKSFSVFH